MVYWRLGPIVPAAFAMVVAVTAAAADQSDPGLAMNYAGAVLAFQTTGDTVPARRLSATSTRRQLEAAVSRIRETAPDLVRAGSVLHLELALAEVETAPDNALFQLRLGEQLLAALARDAPTQPEDFVARWSVVASSIFQARTDLPRARTALALGLARRSRDSRVRQSAGAIEDLASLLAENDDTGLADRRSTARRRVTIGHIASAERDYREALALRPDNAMARIRLGRLLHRRNRLDDARREFATAQTGALTPGERYLLLLFQSSTHEALGDLATARAALQEAVRLAGNRQVSWLALAQLEERAGHPERARGVIAQSVARAAATPADEWWDYRHGGLDNEGLTWLRGIAASSR